MDFKQMLQQIKSRLFKTHTLVTPKELFIGGIIILLATYFIAPKFFEPGGESFKNWVSARIFSRTGGFPVLHHAPLYNLYLQFYLLFDYPLSIQLEHFVTHTFTYISIYFLLRKFLPPGTAMLLTFAWIPTLWTIEGGARVAGIGFFALYIGADKESAFNKGYLPASLATAALFDTAFIVFLMGHIIGTAFVRYSHKEPIIDLSCSGIKNNYFPIIYKFLLIVVVILTISFQSKRPDNNVHGIYYPWAPIPMGEILTESNLQIGNWKYVRRNIPQPEWINQDWYFTHEKAFGGAKTILRAAQNNPKLFFGNILEELPSALMLPFYFLAGFSFPMNFIGKTLFILSWFLLPVSLYKIYQHFRDNELHAHLYSIPIGTVAVMTALGLTYFKDRYSIVLLPLGLLTAVYLGMSLKFLFEFFKKSMAVRFRNESVTADSKGRSLISIAGMLFILFGFFVNAWSVTALFNLTRVLKITTSGRLVIWAADLLLIGIGILLITKRDKSLAVLKEIKDSRYSMNDTWTSNITILILAVCIFVTTYTYPGISGLMDNPFKLRGTVNRVNEQYGILKDLNKRTRVLALEAPLISAFADIDLDNVFHPLVLPPFKDSSGVTGKFLESLDVIWVSNSFSNKAPSIATQSYLRYYLHVGPFLKNAVKRGWTVEEIEGFGKIYRKPKQDENTHVNRSQITGYKIHSALKTYNINICKGEAND